MQFRRRSIERAAAERAERLVQRLHHRRPVRQLVHQRRARRVFLRQPMHLALVHVRFRERDDALAREQRRVRDERTASPQRVEFIFQRARARDVEGVVQNDVTVSRESRLGVAGDERARDRGVGAGEAPRHVVRDEPLKNVETARRDGARRRRARGASRGRRRAAASRRRERRRRRRRRRERGRARVGRRLGDDFRAVEHDGRQRGARGAVGVHGERISAGRGERGRYDVRDGVHGDAGAAVRRAGRARRLGGDVRRGAGTASESGVQRGDGADDGAVRGGVRHDAVDERVRHRQGVRRFGENAGDRWRRDDGAGGDARVFEFHGLGDVHERRERRREVLESVHGGGCHRRCADVSRKSEESRRFRRRERARALLHDVLDFVHRIQISRGVGARGADRAVRKLFDV